MTEENVAAVRALLRALQIDVAEDRLPALAAAYFDIIAQSISIREETTPTPDPAPYDAAWEVPA